MVFKSFEASISWQIGLKKYSKILVQKSGLSEGFVVFATEVD